MYDTIMNVPISMVYTVYYVVINVILLLINFKMYYCDYNNTIVNNNFIT